jgi:hypothetical protein
MEQVLQNFSLPQRFLQQLDIRGRIKRLPLPMQAFVNFNLAQLLALSIALPDFIPLVDEVAAGWLFYMGITATAQSVRERYGDRFQAWRQRRLERQDGLALPDLEQAELQELDPSLIEMTLVEIEQLDPQVLQNAIAGLRRGT